MHMYWWTELISACHPRHEAVEYYCKHGVNECLELDPCCKNKCQSETTHLAGELMTRIVLLFSTSCNIVNHNDRLMAGPVYLWQIYGRICSLSWCWGQLHARCIGLWLLTFYKTDRKTEVGARALGFLTGPSRTDGLLALCGVATGARGRFGPGCQLADRVHPALFSRKRTVLSPERSG